MPKAVVRCWRDSTAHIVEDWDGEHDIQVVCSTCGGTLIGMASVLRSVWQTVKRYETMVHPEETPSVPRPDREEGQVPNLPEGVEYRGPEISAASEESPNPGGNPGNPGNPGPDPEAPPAPPEPETVTDPDPTPETPPEETPGPKTNVIGGAGYSN